MVIPLIQQGKMTLAASSTRTIRPASGAEVRKVRRPVDLLVHAAGGVAEGDEALDHQVEAADQVQDAKDARGEHGQVLVVAPDPPEDAAHPRRLAHEHDTQPEAHRGQVRGAPEPGLDEGGEGVVPAQAVEGGKGDGEDAEAGHCLRQGPVCDVLGVGPFHETQLRKPRQERSGEQSDDPRRGGVFEFDALPRTGVYLRFTVLHRQVALDHVRHADVVRLGPPACVGEGGHGDEAEGGNLQQGNDEALLPSRRDLHDGPDGLHRGDGLGKAVLLRLVADLLVRGNVVREEDDLLLGKVVNVPEVPGANVDASAVSSHRLVVVIDRLERRDGSVEASDGDATATDEKGLLQSHEAIQAARALDELARNRQVYQSGECPHFRYDQPGEYDEGLPEEGHAGAQGPRRYAQVHGNVDAQADRGQTLPDDAGRARSAVGLRGPSLTLLGRRLGGVVGSRGDRGEQDC